MKSSNAVLGLFALIVALGLGGGTAGYLALSFLPKEKAVRAPAKPVELKEPQYIEPYRFDTLTRK